MNLKSNTTIVAMRYLVITLALFGISNSFAADSSETVVKQLIGGVSSELDKLYKENRINDRAAIEKLIRTMIVPHVDELYLARRVFRQFWPQIAKAGKEEDAQKRVIDSLVRTYAVALSSYSGDTLSVISVNEEGKKSTARTRILRTNGEVIQVDFALSNNTGQWMINDMEVDGIVESLTLFQAIKPIWEQLGMEAGLNAVHEVEAVPANTAVKNSKSGK